MAANMIADALQSFQVAVDGELIECRWLVRSTDRVLAIAERVGSGMDAEARVAKPTLAERVI